MRHTLATLTTISLIALSPAASAQTPWGSEPTQPPAQQPAQAPPQQPPPQQAPPQQLQPVQPGVPLQPMPVAAEAPVGWTYVPPRRPEVPRRRFDVGIEVDEVHTMGSAYGAAVSSWGYGGFNDMVQVSLRGSIPIQRWLQVGLRVGYTLADGGVARYDHANLRADLFDVGGVARLIYEWASYRGVVGRIGMEFDAGVSLASVRLRGQDSGGALARIAGVGFIGIAPGLRWPAFVFHFGYQYVPYGAPGVAGSTDPVFSGLVVGLGIEVPL
jgi:hypothetical protein